MVRCSVLGCKSDSERKIPDLSFHSSRLLILALARHISTKIRRFFLYTIHHENKTQNSAKGSMLCIFLFFSVVSNDTSDEKVINFNVDELALLQFKFKYTGDDGGSLEVYVSLMKHESERDSIVQIKMTCGTTTVQSQCNWKLLSKRQVACKKGFYLSDLEVNLTVHKVQIVGFASLFEDTDFTDFKLSAPDGKVDVHKACLAAHSDYFKRMLVGQWKETIEGNIEMVGLNVGNLRHLKEYLYKGILPDDHEELRALLLLADQCLIAQLKTDCIIKLVQSVSPENYFSLHEFACTYNFPELSITIKDHFLDDVVNEAYQLRRTKTKNT